MRLWAILAWPGCVLLPPTPDGFGDPCGDDDPCPDDLMCVVDAIPADSGTPDRVCAVPCTEDGDCVFRDAIWGCATLEAPPYCSAYYRG